MPRPKHNFDSSIPKTLCYKELRDRLDIYVEEHADTFHELSDLIRYLVREGLDRLPEESNPKLIDPCHRPSGLWMMFPSPSARLLLMLCPLGD